VPIVGTDIRLRYSVTQGAAGNSQAWQGPGTSRGRYVSNTVLPDGGMNNLFPDITGDENAAQNVDYQCVFVHNAHPTLTLKSARAWIASQVPGGSEAAIAVDNIGAKALGSTDAQAGEIANKDQQPPATGAYSSATTKAGGIALGDLGPGTVRAIWVRRTAANSGATANDGVTLRVEGDTAA
jgi:hypothetical protein